MPTLAARPKHPQPLLQIETPSTSDESIPQLNGDENVRLGGSVASLNRPTTSGLPSAQTSLIGSNGNKLGPARPSMLRAKSDFGPRRDEPSEVPDEDSKASIDGEFKIRHGFESQLTSEEYNTLLNSTFFMYYTDKKHETGGQPKYKDDSYPVQEWRTRDRLKTVSAVLALCLNIGVDPPDVIKTNPCAKLECWIDPTTSTSASGHTPMNQIGKELQTQYEQLSMRTRYKLCLDPTVEETKRYCQTLRKNARNERVLFHYNGHGVPRPTASGEIWVFNRNYTQYIPISLYDLQSWIGAPSLFVYDCSDAGTIIANFNRFAEKHESEALEQRRRDPHVEVADFSDCIHLAACMEGEILPTNPDLPADIFTACLTTPIEMAVRFFILQNPLPSGVTLADTHHFSYSSEILGRASERRTPIGELNWIFTAITDTIAWNSLSKPLFKKLFRQDLMVAALFRNFLLAQRIMRVYHCHPVCHPEIPQTHDHPLWKSWDLAVEMILTQLPDLLAAKRGGKPYEYQHSNFFAEQLTAFQVYLMQDAQVGKVPEQLPIVLQVLLSQVHRLRALVLLSKFLDQGPWAVLLALSIGIFPYVLKLLQSQAVELKPVMVFIWARILAVDQSCQADLLKDNGYQYFISIFHPTSQLPVHNQVEHRAMCAFIIAMFCKDYHQGQTVSLTPELIEDCVHHLNDLQNPLIRQWSALLLAKLWVNFPEAKWAGIRCSAHQRLCELVLDPVAEVRAAMLYALTAFLGIPDLTPQVANIEESIASIVLVMSSDGNSMVRRELVVFFSAFIARYKIKFTVAAYEHLLESTNSPRSETAFDKEAAQLSQDGLFMKTKSSTANGNQEASQVSSDTVFFAMWRQLLILSVDPHPDIAQSAGTVVDHVIKTLLECPLGQFAEPLLDEIRRSNQQRKPRQPVVQEPTFVAPETAPTSPIRQDGYFAAGMRRTASVAASLKNLAWGGSSSTNLAQSNSLKASARSNGDRSTGPRSRLPSDWNRPPDENDRPQTPAVYQPAKPPRSRNLHERDANRAPEIPIKSTFFDWSVEYFREPQMKTNEADEPGSVEYNERLWRRNRNDGIIAKTQPQKQIAGSSKWDRSKGFVNNGSQPAKMCFHQFEEHLVVTDNRDTVCIWDWERQTRLNRFSNSNPLDSRITEVRFINEDDQALLMTGSSDGVVKVFRNYEKPKDVELVTAFRALTDLVPSNKNAGLVFDWQQSRGLILVAGDVKVIRVWNAGSEVCTSDIPARSGSCITSLTSDQVEGDVFIAGFGDGAVRVYDQREKPQTAMVKAWKEHKQWITNVHLQRGGQRELVTGCRSGEIKLWDIRMDRSVKTIKATRDTLRSLSVHEHAPVFATGSERHTVKLFNLNTGSYLSHFQPHTSFLHQNRTMPIACTAFHPHRMMIAAAALNDTHVNIFAGPWDG